MSWEISLLYFFSWNFIWFLQKEPTTVQNFRLSTAQVKFHQICTLIGYFYWKYIKFQLKKSMEELSHDTIEWRKIWRKTYFLFQKWQEFGKFSSEHLKKSTEELYFMTLECDTKFEEKLTCGLENDMRNLANFHQSTRNPQNWDFHWILLYKVEYVWA